MTERMERAAEAAARRVEAAQDAASRRVEAAQDAASRGVDAVQEAATRGLEAAQRGVEVAQDAAAEVVAKVKPRLRGVIHEYSFFAAIALGALLVWQANGGRETAAMAIYAAGICGLFGISALYHRVTWSAAGARLDAAPGPLDDLRVHRRVVHAVRAAGARRHARDDDPRRDLGRRAGRRRPLARLDRRAEVADGARLRRARDGRRS